MVEGACQATTVHSYADNWELVFTDPVEAPRSWAVMQEFAADVSLQLDVSKTYAWALHSSDRTYLRRNQLQVRYDAKDLGGHVLYSKKRTMHTLKTRLVSNSDVWTWLTRSQSSVPFKLQLLSAVVWPRMLHGISSVWISGEHFKKLRAAAMQSLSWQKKGASSFVQFALGPKLVADPAYNAMQQTFLDFRRYCQPDVAFPALDALVNQKTNRFTQGPCGAFLLRLHELGWSWQSNGVVADHHGRTFHLLDSPIQLLHARLQEGWAAMAGGLGVRFRACSMLGRP